jgi:hypothetical protein
MRSMLLLGTAALALSLTGVAAFASGSASPAPTIYDPAWQASQNVQPPRAVLGAYFGNNAAADQTVDQAVIQPHYTR